MLGSNLREQIKKLSVRMLKGKNVKIISEIEKNKKLYLLQFEKKEFLFEYKICRYKIKLSFRSLEFQPKILTRVDFIIILINKRVSSLYFIGEG